MPYREGAISDPNSCRTHAATGSNECSILGAMRSTLIQQRKATRGHHRQPTATGMTQVKAVTWAFASPALTEAGRLIARSLH